MTALEGTNSPISGSGQIGLVPSIAAKKISLEGQFQSHGVTPRSKTGMLLQNLMLKVESTTIKLTMTGEAKDAKLQEISLKKIRSVDVDGKIYRVSTQEMLKALHLETVGEATLEEESQELLIRDIKKSPTKIEEQVRYLITNLKEEEDRKVAVRKAVMEEIPKENLEALNSRIEQLGTVDFMTIDPESPEYDSYLQALSSGSTTAQSKSEGSTATKNMADADKLIKGWAQEGRKIDLSLISNLNKCLTKDTENNQAEPGAFRGEGVKTKASSGSNYLAGSHVESEMTELCDWVNGELEKAQGDPKKVVEIAARAMSWAVSVHPFSDGNGRTCRMLVNLILIKGGLPPAIVDSERGIAARFGDNLVYLNQTKAELDDEERNLVLNSTGPPPQKVLENLIRSIEITVEMFGKPKS